MRPLHLRRFFLYAAIAIMAGIAVGGQPSVSVAANAGAVVEFDGRPGLVVRSAPAGVTAEERARLIGDRLSTIAQNPRIRIEKKSEKALAYGLNCCIQHRNHFDQVANLKLRGSTVYPPVPRRVLDPRERMLGATGS